MGLILRCCPFLWEVCSTDRIAGFMIVIPFSVFGFVVNSLPRGDALAWEAASIRSQPEAAAHNLRAGRRRLPAGSCGKATDTEAIDNCQLTIVNC
jgi:hypothetical protein